MENRRIVIVLAALLTLTSCYDFSLSQRDSGSDTAIDPALGRDGSATGGDQYQSIGCPGGLQCDNACVPNDARNCGRCGHNCTLLPHVAGKVDCGSNGECVVSASSCAPGYADCSTTTEDGCETDISKTFNCGACGEVCPQSTPRCAPKDPAGTASAGYQCRADCPPGAPTLCPDSTCVSINASPNNCGGCGNQCQESAGGQSVCEGGKCTVSCYDGYHDCDGKCLSNTSPDSCGKSCVPCKAPLNSVATCDGNKCGSRCQRNYLLCDGQCIPNNEKNCGTCGHDCTALAHVTGAAICKEGVCSLPPESCAAGWGHCTTNTDDGCETNISTANDCGECNKKCSADLPVCQRKAGSTSASTTYECTTGCKSSDSPDLCDSSCVNITKDISNCGECGNVCDQPANATATCINKTCGFTCKNSSDNKCTNGCFPKKDAKNCGKCGNDCKGLKCDSSGKCVECISDTDCGGNVCVTGGACKDCNPSNSNSCGICKKCNAQGSCDNFADNTQDPAGCKGTCKACQNGSCGNADANTDPGDKCTKKESGSAPCPDGNCNGSGACNSSGGSSVKCYRDSDGDGFGDSTSSTSLCGNSCDSGTGYVSNDKDCDDADGEAHPGQIGWFTRERKGKEGYDFDCNGEEKKQEVTCAVGCLWQHQSGTDTSNNLKRLCDHNPVCESTYYSSCTSANLGAHNLSTKTLECGKQYPDFYCVNNCSSSNTCTEDPSYSVLGCH